MRMPSRSTTRQIGAIGCGRMGEKLSTGASAGRRALYAAAARVATSQRRGRRAVRRPCHGSGMASSRERSGTRSFAGELEHQPVVVRDPRLVGDGPQLLAPRVADEAADNAAPEFRSARVLGLECDLPRARIGLDRVTGESVADSPAALRANDEEVTHMPNWTIGIHDVGKANGRALEGREVAVRTVSEVALEAAELEQPLVVRHGAPELRHVVRVQLPQPL